MLETPWLRLFGSNSPSIHSMLLRASESLTMNVAVFVSARGFVLPKYFDNRLLFLMTIGSRRYLALR
jgi:hypothetical protein